MNIMELGAIGEIVGGVAVIGSLIYVGLQVHQNTLSQRGATLHALNDSYTAVYGLIAQDPTLADIYAKGLSGGELTATDVVRYEALLQFHFAWLEDIYHQQKLNQFGTTPSKEDSALAAGAPFFKRLLDAPYAKEWWDRDAQYQYTADFYSEASLLLLGREAPNGIGHHSPSRL